MTWARSTWAASTALTAAFQALPLKPAAFCWPLALALRSDLASAVSVTESHGYASSFSFSLSSFSFSPSLSIVRVCEPSLSFVALDYWHGGGAGGAGGAGVISIDRKGICEVPLSKVGSDGSIRIDGVGGGGMVWVCSPVGVGDRDQGNWSLICVSLSTSWWFDDWL